MISVIVAAMWRGADSFGSKISIDQFTISDNHCQSHKSSSKGSEVEEICYKLHTDNYINKVTPGEQTNSLNGIIDTKIKHHMHFS